MKTEADCIQKRNFPEFSWSYGVNGDRPFQDSTIHGIGMRFAFSVLHYRRKHLQEVLPLRRKKSMKRIWLMTIALTATLFVTVATVGASPSDESLTVGADPSLKAAFQELMPLFKQEYGAAVHVVYGPSKILRRAIEKGEAFDVLITSAKELELLHKKKLTRKGRSIAQTSLVLVMSEASSLLTVSFNEVWSNRSARIALADPRLSTLGEMTAQLIPTSNLKTRTGISYAQDGEDISKLLQVGKADVGIMYRADAINNGEVYIIEEAPNGMEIKDQLAAAIVSTAKKPSLKIAEKFVDFMTSLRIQKLLLKYGFDPVPLPFKHAAHFETKHPA
ncbi:MAG: molybdate ABC transporter substrate-binding protein [Nitrospirae bacterium]|nr:MAG: molybdate ABC transporter substrate-binding protein [Nitrospirota bacterium]